MQPQGGPAACQPSAQKAPARRNRALRGGGGGHGRSQVFFVFLAYDGRRIAVLWRPPLRTSRIGLALGNRKCCTRRAGLQPCSRQSTFDFLADRQTGRAWGGGRVGGVWCLGSLVCRKGVVVAFGVAFGVLLLVGVFFFAGMGAATGHPLQAQVRHVTQIPVFQCAPHTCMAAERSLAHHHITIVELLPPLV